MSDKKTTHRDDLLQLIPGYQPGKPLPAPAPVAEDAKKSAQEARAAILPAKGAPPQEQGFLAFAPMPTDLCRVSPFFPMSKNEMANRPYIEDLPITKCAWGGINYTGPKLSIYDEDVLMAVVALINAVFDGEGYTFKGPGAAVLKVMGYEKPSKVEYKKLALALTRLHSAVFTLHVKGDKTRIRNILSKADIGDKTNEYDITVNPYFYEMYLSGSVTFIDVIQRRKLKKSSAKALYRFMQSHRNGEWQGHFLTLAAALNLNLGNEPKEIRRQIRDAMAELKKNGMLDKSSGFVRGSADVVRLVRPGAAKPALK